MHSLLLALLLLGDGDKPPVAPPAAERVVVELQPDVRVRGCRVQLRDVACIKGADAPTAARLGAIDLGPRPEGAWVRRLDVAQVRKAVELALADGAAVVAFAGADRVAVLSEHATVRGDDLAAAADLVLRATLQRFGEVDMETNPQPRPADLRVAPGRESLELTATIRDGRVTRTGALVDVSVRIDGEVARTVPVWFQVRRFREVLTARTQIRSDEPFTRDNIEARRVDVSTLPFEPVTDDALLAGKVAARALRAGSPITVEDVINPPAVRRGEIVTLVSRAGRVRITTKAVCQRDALAGAIVPVVAQSGERVLFARVAGPGVVVVGDEK